MESLKFVRQKVKNAPRVTSSTILQFVVEQPGAEEFIS